MKQLIAAGCALAAVVWACRRFGVMTNQVFCCLVACVSHGAVQQNCQEKIPLNVRGGVILLMFVSNVAYFQNSGTEGGQPQAAIIKETKVCCVWCLFVYARLCAQEQHRARVLETARMLAAVQTAYFGQPYVVLHDPLQARTTNAHVVCAQC